MRKYHRPLFLLLTLAAAAPIVAGCSSDAPNDASASADEALHANQGFVLDVTKLAIFKQQVGLAKTEVYQQYGEDPITIFLPKVLADATGSSTVSFDPPPKKSYPGKTKWTVGFSSVDAELAGLDSTSVDAHFTDTPLDLVITANLGVHAVGHETVSGIPGVSDNPFTSRSTMPKS